MTNNTIGTQLSTKELTFKPGGTPATFEVTVVNESDRFASFQLEVIAAGADVNRSADWYVISPEVSTKKPPGDFTQFQIAIVDTPVPGFVGQMNLTVRVFSVELRDEDREILRLILERGSDRTPLKLDLPIEEFAVYPGNQIEIPVRVYNPGQLPTHARLQCLGIDPTWLIDGKERRLALPPGGQAETSFSCQPPLGTGAVSRRYPITIEATHRHGATAQVTGILDILPAGDIFFRGTPERHYLPATWRGFFQQRAKPVTYTLEFDNRSNVHQQVSLKVEGENLERCTLEAVPEQTALNPGEMAQLQLQVNARRPWWGIARKLELIAAPILSDPRLGATEPASQPLELRVRPLIPLWLQLGGALALLLLLLLGLNLRQRHGAPVQSVAFNGRADWAVSGANDQTVRQWRVDGSRLQGDGVVAEVDKAVRVVRFQPVDNDVVAVGLENGEILLVDLLSQARRELVYQQDDRVFGLEFTRDSRYLFSGHGNDLVLQWDLEQIRRNRASAKLSDRSQRSEQPLRTNQLNAERSRSVEPERSRRLNFTISDLALVGQAEQFLAIGGRFNRLVLWDWLNENSEGAVRSLPYPRSGNQGNYITSLAVAADAPNLLSVADDQGYITLWDLSQCLKGQGDCQKLDEWQGGEEGQAVRSVALSANGCYLASVGDDRRVIVWSLTTDGRRAAEFLAGDAIARSGQKLNSVDIKLVGKDLFIVSGGDDHRVRLHRLKNRFRRYQEQQPLPQRCEGE